MTGETVTDPAGCATSSRRCALAGIATEEEEAVLGECGLAAPVLDSAGEAIGAIGLVVPSRGVAGRRRAVDALRETARAVSRELGAVRWPPEVAPA